MPRRSQLIVTGQVYHVFNRSVGNKDIFDGKRELSRLFELIKYYRYSHTLRFSKFKLLSKERRKEYISWIIGEKGRRLVEIFAYAFMPDHYHLLLRQERKGGIKDYVSNFRNAYAKYFNIKNKSRGSLFINPFKAKRVESDEILLHVSRYIHLNPVTSYLIEIDKLHQDFRTSFPDYIKKSSSGFVNTKFLIDIIGSRNKYNKFIEDQVAYQRKLRLIKKLTLD